MDRKKCRDMFFLVRYRFCNVVFNIFICSIGGMFKILKDCYRVLRLD